MARAKKSRSLVRRDGYRDVLGDVRELIDASRRSAVRSVNAIMTAVYWSVGRRIVEEEQRGAARAGYGDELVARLAADLGMRGFAPRNLRQMRAHYLAYPQVGGRPIPPTAPAGSDESPASSPATAGEEPPGNYFHQLVTVARAFPLPWSHYVRLLAVKNPLGRRFYEEEALRGGWTVRQLQRQIGSMFYERTVMSRNKPAILDGGRRAEPGDHVALAELIRDPFLLEFLDLKDDYAERDLEDAVVLKLQDFLLELGGDFAFLGRHRRLRIGDSWHRVDLLFFHRRLHCLVVIDLELDDPSPAADPMPMYLDHARAHWSRPGENPPIGLVLRASKGATLARYALEGLGSRYLAAEYLAILPPEAELAEQLRRALAEVAARRRPPRAREPRLDWSAILAPWPSARSLRSDTPSSASEHVN